MTFLEVDDLTIEYETPRGNLTAAANVSFSIEESEMFGLVGESGCGKSTVAHSLIGGLDSNGEITSGSIHFKGSRLDTLTESAFNSKIRWDEISLIPQDALESLDPLQRISEKAVEITRAHSSMSKADTIDRLKELFSILGIQEERVKAYPHQLSGGMQQRAMIALALLLDPSLIIADEPTTALDVIMEDQVFKWLEDAQAETGVSILLITHDISVVFENCSRFAVLHSGQVAEIGTATSIFDNPRHPYTILLQEAFPDIRYPDKQLRGIDGYPPELLNMEDGVNYCTFADRCPWAVDECRESSPKLTLTEDATDQYHEVACYRSSENLQEQVTEVRKQSSEPLSGESD